MNNTGFKNRLPRRGTRQDAAMRKHRLKNQRDRLPRTRDMDKLLLQAQRDMAREVAGFGVGPQVRGQEGS